MEICSTDFFSQPGVVVLSYIPSPWEVEAQGWSAGGQPGLHTENLFQKLARGLEGWLRGQEWLSSCRGHELTSQQLTTTAEASFRASDGLSRFHFLSLCLSLWKIQQDEAKQKLYIPSLWKLFTRWKACPLSSKNMCKQKMCRCLWHQTLQHNIGSVNLREKGDWLN